MASSAKPEISADDAMKAAKLVAEHPDLLKKGKEAYDAVDKAVHSETGQKIIHETEELAHKAYDIATSEQAKEIYRETGNWFTHTLLPWAERTGRSTQELIWKVTDDVLSGHNTKRGEPDVLLVEWRRCRRCQAQFDPDKPAATECRYHPARFECLKELKAPFTIKHRDTSKCDTETCKGRFPCCGAMFALDSAESNGCKKAERHTC